jgi:hypothetical protein
VGCKKTKQIGTQLAAATSPTQSAISLSVFRLLKSAAYECSNFYYHMKKLAVKVTEIAKIAKIATLTTI